jgi:hypothetical protein
MPDEGARSPDRFAAEAAAVVDPLLADLWPLIWSVSSDGSVPAERVAALLRMAYLQGYGDALDEPERGEVFRRIGVRVPQEPAPKPSRSRRPRGSSGNSDI